MSDTDKTPTQCATVQGNDSPCAARERARIIELVQNLGDEWTRAYDMNGIDVNEDAIAVLEEVIALINGEALADNRLSRQGEDTSHE